MNVKLYSSAIAIVAVMTVIAPASAAGLLGGLLGGGSGGGSTGGGVPGVATVSVNNGGTGTQGNATVLGGGGSTINVGLGSVLGGNSNLGVTLPGTGSSQTDGIANTVNGLTGNGGTVDTLLGSTGLTGDTGGLGGVIGGDGGLLGGNGGAPGTPGGPGAPGTPGGGNFGNGGFGGYLAQVGGAPGTSCGGQNPAAIARLIQSRNYSPQVLRGWAKAAGVQLVPVKLCPQIRASIRRGLAMNSGVNYMQQVAANDPLISASLARSRHSADDVMAVDQANGMLTVYVY